MNDDVVRAEVPAREIPRSRRPSLAGNPALIGAVTVLVSIVSVFLAYNATEGLPFAPTYDIEVELPDALNLIHGNEVKLGGNRVGLVNDVVPAKTAEGRPIALAKISLDPVLQELPADSTWVVRPRSPFGLKYLELTPGTSPEKLIEGGRVSVEQIQPEAVDWHEFQSLFEERTRRGIRRSLRGFGDALAGRGSDINTLIPALAPLLEAVEPVMSNLASERTRLRRFFPALERFIGELAPVSGEQARLFVALDTTFTALSGVARPHLQEFWEAQAPLYAAGIRHFPGQQRFLENVAALWEDLQPGASALIDAAPHLADMTDAGLRNLPGVPALNRDLRSFLDAFEEFSTDPVVPRGINRLRETVRVLRPALDHLVPLQTECNYLSVFFRNFASLLSEGDGNGTWGRAVAIVPSVGKNSEGSPSPIPANGPEIDNFLHHNNYPNSAAPGQPDECEAGNEDYYVGRQMLGNLPGNQGLGKDMDTRKPIEYFGGGFEPEPGGR